MKVHFLKADPSGNTTIFIIDDVPRALYPKVANVLMSPRCLSAEQVGYIHKDSTAPGGIRMDMCGGEFCGNASRSFAAWLKLHRGDGTELKNFDGKEDVLDIAVSGTSGILSSTVRNIGADNGCNVNVSMPVPSSIRHGKDPYFGDYSIACFDGITHLVLWDRAPSDKDIPKAKEFLVRGGYPIIAFGVMFYETKTSRLTPVVYVDEVGSLVWESSCGSGSSGVAASLSDKKRASVSLTMHQPGGDLTVAAEWHGKVDRIILSGDIYFTAAGTVYIDDEKLK